MTDLVQVQLGDRSYEVQIASGLLSVAGEKISPLLRREKVWIVTESNVAALHLPKLEAGLEAGGIAHESLVLPPGESTKDWAHLQQIVHWLLSERVERSDIVIAFGGGVIGDLVGFAAAIHRRGIRFVQIPTSLLAQVDSSVGGKTGINTEHGKNLVGAFHQPSLVLADIDVLQTLDPRDFLAGYGEVAKYGLLGSAEFFEWLEESGPKLAAGQADLIQNAVRTSVQMKADIVARDEIEQGDRALLNLGHTFCHALEAATGYSQRLLHGEGVAIGCVMAFELSARLGLCAQELPGRVSAHFETMGSKRQLSQIEGALPSADEFMNLMAQDKKVLDGKLRFILARDIGEAFVASDVPTQVVADLWSDTLAAR